MAPHPFFSFHHANAFETGDGKVVLDTVANLEGVDFSANFEVRGETVEVRGETVEVRGRTPLRCGGNR